MYINKVNNETEIVIKENQHPRLCVCLGFFLSLFGIMIAAIIGKGDGVIKAFIGIGVRWLLIISSCVFFGNLGKSMYDDDLASNNVVKVYPKTNWNLDESISPIDDSKTYVLTCDAREQYGWRKEKPCLIVRYKEGKLDAYIVFGTYLGAGDDIDVVTRFDSCEAVTASGICQKRVMQCLSLGI